MINANHPHPTTDANSSGPFLLRSSLRAQPARELPGAGGPEPGGDTEGEDVLPHS